MLIGTYRNVELIISRHPLKSVKQELLAKQQCEELPLVYLTTDAVSKYLSVRFSGNRFPAGLAGLIHERTDGNPLFMVNAVDYLVGAGLIAERENTWELVVDLENVQVGVPDNIKQMIEKQVAHLGDENQQTLEAASVAGVEFSALALASALDEDLDVVQSRCDELASKRQYIQDCGIQELPNGEMVPRLALYTRFIKTYCMSVCLYREERSFIGALLKKEKKFTESAPGRLRASSRCTLNAVATTSGRQNIFSRLRI
jgi:hypothetical protein